MPRKAGRPQGSSGVHATSVKEMIRRALNNLGGVDYLIKVGIEQPSAFLSLLAKTVPQEIKQEITANMSFWDSRAQELRDVTPKVAVIEHQITDEITEIPLDASDSASIQPEVVQNPVKTDTHS